MAIPHKTDRELRKFGYVPDSDIRSIIREIEAVKLDLRRGEPGLADHWVRGTRYPVEMERTLKLAWNDPERDGHMIHARYFLEQARRAVREYKRHHGRIPACAERLRHSRLGLATANRKTFAKHELWPISSALRDHGDRT